MSLQTSTHIVGASDPAMDLSIEECSALACATKNELFEELLRLATTKNFALFIERSDSKKKKVVIWCDRGGKYTTTAIVRTTKKKKTGCEYRLFGKQGVDGI